MVDDRIEPFIKWPGGKRWLFKRYKNLFPAKFNRLIDPFVGGAASFFYLNPAKAILSDINADLINTYCVMKHHSHELSECMKNHQNNHNESYYYQIRNSEKSLNEIEQAARFLYLNRMCFNGMYRVNQKGKFNVPIGTKKSCINDIKAFEKYAELLERAEFRVCDFYESITLARGGDLIFADPPYAFTKEENGFTLYNDTWFSWDDQIRLCEALSAAREREADIFAMNAYNKEIIEMYKEKGFHIISISRFSSIAGNPQKRQEQMEILISSSAQIKNWESML